MDFNIDNYFEFSLSPKIAAPDALKVYNSTDLIYSGSSPLNNYQSTELSPFDNHPNYLTNNQSTSPQSSDTFTKSSKSKPFRISIYHFFRVH